MRFLTAMLRFGKAAPGKAKASGKSKTAGKPGRGKRKAAGKRPHPLLRARTLAWGAAGVLTIAVAGSATWAIASGWAERKLQAAVDGAHAVTAHWGLAVGEVFVAGREETERETLLAALQVDEGDPLLTFDPWAAQARLEALPWIRRATIERRLPDTIFVRLVERRPLALWQLHGRLAVIDQSGEIIPGAEAKRFSSLPLVVGEDAPRHTAGLLSILGREPELNRKVTAAVRVAGRRWNIQLAGGIDVQLPESEPAQAWSQLANIEREHSVLQRNVVTIDLRLPDRLIIRTEPGVAIERPTTTSGEDT